MEINVINRGEDFGLLTQTAAVPRLLAHRMALAEYIFASSDSQQLAKPAMRRARP